jgi:mRNA interferase MazF
MGWQVVTLSAGDVVYANLDPTRGIEQRGTRPVVVISAVQMGPRAIVVPMTTKRRDWPTRIRTSVHGIEGDAMCEQVRTVDVGRLWEDTYGSVPSDTLSGIRRTVARLIGVY